MRAWCRTSFWTLDKNGFRFRSRLFELSALLNQNCFHVQVIGKLLPSGDQVEISVAARRNFPWKSDENRKRKVLLLRPSRLLSKHDSKKVRVFPSNGESVGCPFSIIKIELQESCVWYYPPPPIEKSNQKKLSEKPRRSFKQDICGLATAIEISTRLFSFLTVVVAWSVARILAEICWETHFAFTLLKHSRRNSSACQAPNKAA